jgi:uncharacterized damage-inducible protein DinB
MNKEIQTLIRRIENTNSGEPWYGRAVLHILEEVAVKKSTVSAGGSAHSMLDILYHMNTWAAFTLNRIKKIKEQSISASEALDWRKIDPKVHTWKKGLTEYKKIYKDLIAELNHKDDDFLLEIVDYRKYNFRFLINGMIDHTIYHAGQIALLNKLPDC